MVKTEKDKNLYCSNSNVGSGFEVRISGAVALNSDDGLRWAIELVAEACWHAEDPFSSKYHRNAWDIVRIRIKQFFRGVPGHFHLFIKNQRQWATFVLLMNQICLPQIKTDYYSLDGNCALCISRKRVNVLSRSKIHMSPTTGCED